MSPEILFEDTHVLAISKPAGMIVNKSDTTKDEVTVQDFAEEYLHLESGTLTHERDDFYDRGGIVHRLDKETSGVLLIAKTPTAFHELQSQFKNRTVQKQYTALVHGVITPQEGEVNVPVGRLEWNRKRFGVVADGREAVTFYKTTGIYTFSAKKKEELSLLTLFPKTGRTHQIRVHMKYLNHPIFADFLYAGRKTARDDRKFLGRVFLHASSITFQHPVSKKEISLSSPLAVELEAFLKEHCVLRL